MGGHGAVYTNVPNKSLQCVGDHCVECTLMCQVKAYNTWGGRNSAVCTLMCQVKAHNTWVTMVCQVKAYNTWGTIVMSLH